MKEASAADIGRTSVGWLAMLAFAAVLPGCGESVTAPEESADAPLAREVGLQLSVSTPFAQAGELVLVDVTAEGLDSNGSIEARISWDEGSFQLLSEDVYQTASVLEVAPGLAVVAIHSDSDSGLAGGQVRIAFTAMQAAATDSFDAELHLLGGEEFPEGPVY